MKKTFLSLMIVAATLSVFAQKKTTTSAIIAFDASTAIDALPKAENKTVVAALDTKTGTIQFEAGIKNFAFSNPRIQEHFNNAGWMDSDQFPSSTFTGKITNLAAINFSKNGTYAADVTGDLTIRGVTQKVSSKGTIVVEDGKIKCSSAFSINVDDYKISGNQIIQGKVSKEPKITVTAEF